MTETAAVREYVLDTHGELLETVLACADGVAKSWDCEATTDRTAVVTPFERALDSAGVIDRFPGVLDGAANALGEELPATPVPESPYVVVTSTGLVLRATLDSGRLIVSIHAFDIEHDPTRYVRGPDDPATALAVELKSR